MELDEDLLQKWRDFIGVRTPRPWLHLDDDGFKVGGGVWLAWLESRAGHSVLCFNGGRERVRARLSCAYNRPVDDRALDVLRKAAIDYAKGEKARAYIRLSHAGFAKFDDPFLAAFRVFGADLLIDEYGYAPRDVLKVLGLQEELAAAKTYDPNEPRNPSGSGLISGRWTSSESDPTSSAAHAADLASLTTDFESGFLRWATPAALSDLASLIVRGLSPAQLAFQFVSNTDEAGPVRSGVAPDMPDISYRWAPSDGLLTIWRTVDGREVPVTLANQGQDGVYFDSQGRAVARGTADGLLIDWKALGLSEARTNADFETASSIAARTSALAQEEAQGKPKLCPSPGKDIGFGNTYQSRVTGLPQGLGVWLHNVVFDGCRLSNGYMVEAKGLRYQRFLLPDGEWRSKFEGGPRLARQLRRQSDAARLDGRIVEWHVAEKRAADKLRDMAKPYPNLIVLWDPEGTYAY